MKTQKKNDTYVVRRENLSQWITKFEDHCRKDADIDENVKDYVEYAMKVCEAPRKYFHNEYLYDLDENLNVPSSKDNYSYHDFYRKPDPYEPFPKGLFRRKDEL